MAGDENEDDEANKSAEEIQFNMGAAQVDDQLMPGDDDFQ